VKRIFGLISKDEKIQKSLSFRLFATIGTFLVAFVFTGQAFTSLGLAGAQAITNTTIYYYHEKAWEKKPEIKVELESIPEEWKKYL
jgi:uncharacterized membrane protein